MKNLSKKNCLTVDLCHVGNPEAPACGTDKEHLMPLPVAESMCPRALAGRINFLKSSIDEESLPARIAEDYASAAWLELESAIARPNGEYASEHIDRSKQYSDLAMSRPYSWFRGIYSAALLNAYRQPLLERKERTPTAHDLDTTRKRLATIYEVLQMTPIHVPQSQHILDAMDNNEPHLPCLESEGEKLGYAAKLTGLMLAARQGTFLYPASTREANATGTWVGLNHDAYTITNGEKKLVKFRSKAKSIVENWDRKTKYDDSTIFINIRAVINNNLTELLSTDRQFYSSILRAFDGKPDVIKIGELLAAEANGEKIHQTKKQFLDLLGAHLDTLLSENNDKPMSSEKKEPTVRSPKVFGKIDDWNILPYWVISHHNSLGAATPEQEDSAFNAAESYLKYGDERPPVSHLKNYINRIRTVSNPKLTAQCVGIYIDLARHPETSPEQAIELIEASQTLAQTLTKHDWQQLDPASVQAQHYAALQSAYGIKYKKALAGEISTIDDEARLYLQLLEVGKTTIEPARYYQAPRGSQAEIALHILNSRFNIRNGRIIQSAWPALPREDDPHTFNREKDPDGTKFRKAKFTRNTAWDLAVTRGAFLDQNEDCRYIQSKSAVNIKKYDPKITMIVSKSDFLLSSTADITNDALAEQTTTDPTEREEIRARLNNYEEIFLSKLGY